MNYYGKKTRKVCPKRRILLPSKWIEEGKIDFFFVEDGYLKIYPDERWKSLMRDMKTDKEKIAWSEKSTQVKIDDSRRLLLPKTCDWRHVNLVGIGDCIVVMKATEKGLFYWWKYIFHFF